MESGDDSETDDGRNTANKRELIALNERGFLVRLSLPHIHWLPLIRDRESMPLPGAAVHAWTRAARKCAEESS
jgi:hypothetical protein